MSNIPPKPRYERTLRFALDFIKNENIQGLPVDVFKLVKKHSAALLTVGEISRKLNISRKRILTGKDADVFYCNGQYKIIYNELVNTNERLRWTLMHELGHIYLGHLEDFEQTALNIGNGLAEQEYYVLEREADFFAAEVLAPQILLKSSGKLYWKYIASLCKISEKAAKIRTKSILENRFWRIYKEYEHDLLCDFRTL